MILKTHLIRICFLLIDLDSGDLHALKIQEERILFIWFLSKQEGCSERTFVTTFLLV